MYQRSRALFETIVFHYFCILSCSLSQNYPQLRNLSGSTEGTIFTEVTNSSKGSCQWRSDRPALVVSGCSWTPDDDFTVLMEALDIYNTVVASSPNIHYHKLICIVTGNEVVL